MANRSSAQNVPAVRDSKTPVLRDKRGEIILGIRGIQPVAGKNLRDVEVPQPLYDLAKVVAEREPAEIRFNKVPVYRLLLDHVKRSGVDPSQVEATLAGWQQASKALFRYALNLVLAPKRPEFKKMKLSSSFYVYNISRNLHGAEQVFLVMGYQVVERQGRGGQDLVYEGDVKVGRVLETATDLLIMHEEIGIIGKLVTEGKGYVTLEQAIMQRWPTNTVHGTGSSDVHPYSQPQPQPGHPQEGSAYSVERTSGSVLPQPYDQIRGQPPQQSQPPIAQGQHGYERKEYALPPLDAGVSVQIQQRNVKQEHENLHQKYGGFYENAELTARGGGQSQHVPQQLNLSRWQSDQYSSRTGQPQRVDPTLQYPGEASQVRPTPTHAPVHEPPPDATLYENVPHQNVGSAYQNIGNLQEPEASLEKITVTQQVRNLYHEYPQLASQSEATEQQNPYPAELPLQENDTEQPTSDDLDLYGDDSNPVPVDSLPPPVETQSVPPAQEEQYSFDLRDLPAPVVRYTSTPASTPASEFYSGITSSLVHSRSIGGCERLSPVDEQPQGLGDRVNDPGYQLQHQADGTEDQHQFNYCRGRSTSTDSKESSIDIYGSPQGEVFRRHISRNRSSSTDSKESSIDNCTSGRGDKLGKNTLQPLREESANLPSDPAPTHPSPLPRGTAHPLETNTQQLMDSRPALQLQGSQDDTAYPIGTDGKIRDKPTREKPTPLPRGLRQQVKSRSVDEVEADGEGGGKKYRGLKTSASGPDLLQHECQSQSSEPSSSQMLDKPVPRPRRSRSPSPLSSAENSPSASPTPPRRNVSSIPENPSQPPGHQLAVVGMPPKAQSVDTETPRREEIREKNPVDQFSSGDLKAAASALAQTSQVSPPLRRVPESPPTQRSSCDLPPNAPVMGISPYAAAAKLKKQRDGSNPLSDQLPPSQLPLSQLPSGRPSSVSSGQPSFSQAGQPALSQPLSGQQFSGQPPNRPSRPPPDPQLRSQAPSQPPQGQQPASQPPSSQSPGQLRPSQPLQGQPLHNKQPTIQPSPDEPGQPRSQQSQRRQPPRELSTTHAPPDRSSLSPPGPLPPKSAASPSTSTVAAKTVDTSESDQSNLDQHRPNRSSIESLEKHLGQDKSKLRRQEHVKQPAVRKRSNAISEPSHPHPKSTELNSSAEDEGGSTGTLAATELEEQFQFSLGDTWVCSYCTNLVKATTHTCDVCGRKKLETLV